MSWTKHINHPSQFVSMGQVVEAIILSLDKDDKKISLGMKQLTPDPWQELLKKYPVGSHHKGIARNLTNFGVFIELEPGIDGLVHISDLSWTKKIRHPGEVVKKGEELEVVVLSVDTEQRKISLGHKQVETNPWEIFEKEYAVGKATTGKIIRIIEKGVIVELPLDVDGFVPQTQLSPARLKNISYCFPVGDELDLVVLDFDRENKKIVLSALAAVRGMDDEDIEKYITSHRLEKVTIDSIRGADLGKFDSSDFSLYDQSADNAANKKAEHKKKENKAVKEKVIEEKATEPETEEVEKAVEENIETVEVETEAVEIAESEAKTGDVETAVETTEEVTNKTESETAEVETTDAKGDDVKGENIETSEEETK